MNHSDYFMTATALWKEARGEGESGMVAVGCVIRNRVNRKGSTYYTECIRKWAFSSITDPKDAQLAIWPAESDPLWQKAQVIAADIIEGRRQDVTGGSTLYYNPNGLSAGNKSMRTLPDGRVIAWPDSWNQAAAQFICQIGNHLFFKE